MLMQEWQASVATYIVERSGCNRKLLSGNSESLDVRIWSSKSGMYRLVEASHALHKSPMRSPYFATYDQNMLSGRHKEMVGCHGRRVSDGFAYRHRTVGLGGVLVHTGSRSSFLTTRTGQWLDRWHLKTHTFAQLEPPGRVLIVTRNGGPDDSVGDFDGNATVVLPIKAIGGHQTKGASLKNNLLGPSRAVALGCSHQLYSQRSVEELSIRNADTGNTLFHFAIAGEPEHSPARRRANGQIMF